MRSFLFGADFSLYLCIFWYLNLFRSNPPGSSGIFLSIFSISWFSLLSKLLGSMSTFSDVCDLSSKPPSFTLSLSLVFSSLLLSSLGDPFTWSLSIFFSSFFSFFCSVWFLSPSCSEVLDLPLFSWSSEPELSAFSFSGFC